MGISSMGLNKTLLRAALVAGLAWTSSTGYSQVIWEIGPAPARPASPTNGRPSYAPSPSPYESRTFSNVQNSNVLTPPIRQGIPSPTGSTLPAETVIASPALGSTPANAMPSRGNGLLPQPAPIPQPAPMAPGISGPIYSNSPNISGSSGFSSRSSATNAAPQQHLPSGSLRSIDVSKLSPDILNCDVCRSRLGLPPLPKQPHSNSNITATSPSATSSTSVPSNFFEVTEAKPMLGSPGLLSAGTGKRLEESGMVVEEFRPPQPKPEDFQLDNLPPEARQQFYQGLDLPRGARVMSAQLLDGKSPSAPNVMDAPTSSVPATNAAPTSRPSRVLGEELPKLDMPAAVAPQFQSLGAPGISLSPVPPIPQPPTVKPSPESIGPPPASTTFPNQGTLPGNHRLNRQDSISNDDVAVASPVRTDPTGSKVPASNEKLESQGLKAESPQSKETPATFDSAPAKQPVAPATSEREAELQKVIQVLREQNTKLTSEIEELKRTNQVREQELMSMLKSNDASLNEQKKILDQQQELEARVRAQTEVFESKLMELEKQNKTTAQMLEARTAEVTELQNKLRAAENRAKREGNSKDGMKPKSKPKNGNSESIDEE